MVKCIAKKVTISVNTTGQKLVRLFGDRRQSNTRIQRKTSLWTTAAGTLRKMSTSFSCIVGSCVRKWFFSAANIAYDNRRRFSDRNNISYSLVVKMFVEGAAATLAER